MQRETVKRLITVLLVIIVTLGLAWWVWEVGVSHGISHTAQVPDEELAIALLLDTADIKFLWSPQLVDSDWVAVSNGVGATRWFAQSSYRTWVNIFEYVFVFPTSELAVKHYNAEVLDLSKLNFQGWDSMPMLQYPHHADDSHIACHEASVNGYHHYGCYVIVRYKRAVGIIGGHIFDTQWVTAEQFRQVLIAADAKFLERLELLDR